MKHTRLPSLDALAKAAGLAGGLFIGAAAFAAPSGAPNAGSAASFDAFRMIGNLNIFDSTRVGWVDDAPKVRVDTISFVGTMDYDKGRLAFFDSSDRSFRKALHAGETIADFTVARVDAEGVELTRDSKSIRLLMGQQLRRPPGGDWAPAAGGARAAPAGERRAAAEEAPVPAGASDILQRLMAKRQQELKQ
jgi:hypothetical protein